MLGHCRQAAVHHPYLNAVFTEKRSLVVCEKSKLNPVITQFYYWTNFEHPNVCCNTWRGVNRAGGRGRPQSSDPSSRSAAKGRNWATRVGSSGKLTQARDRRATRTACTTVGPGAGRPRGLGVESQCRHFSADVSEDMFVSAYPCVYVHVCLRPVLCN